MFDCYYNNVSLVIMSLLNDVCVYIINHFSDFSINKQLLYYSTYSLIHHLIKYLIHLIRYVIFMNIISVYFYKDGFRGHN